MPDLRSFTHRIYVDFSGDDGHYNTPGSSQCICIAWVLSNEEYLDHNRSVVLKIKKAIGCDPKHELKYKTLRRHKNREIALRILSQLKVKVVIIPVFKRYISEQELRDPHTKKLVDLLHTFPLERFFPYMRTVNPKSYFQLIFDEVSWSGCPDDIIEDFKNNQNLDWGQARSDWLLFAKSHSNLMIQLADIISGVGREFADGLIGRALPPCPTCVGKRKMQHCPYKLGRLKIPGESLLHTLQPLLLRKEGECFEQGFVVRPPNRTKYFRFVDCL